MTEISASRKGSLTAKKNGIQLYSGYDPEKEAYQFAANTSVKDEALVLIFEPGLGYLAAELKKLKPYTEIYTVKLDAGLAVQSSGDNSWHAASGISFKTFLNSILTEDNLTSLEIICWPPVLKAYASEYEEAAKILLQKSTELKANIFTAAGFGRRWIKNIVFSFLRLETAVEISTSSRPLLIAASGPTLEKSMEFIKKCREDILLIALPSSIETLLFNGLKPDLTVLTDPGFYSGCNFYKYRALDASVCAAPLYSHFPKTKHRLILETGFSEEKIFLKELNLNAFKAAENGTVAGTALELAFSLSSGNIFFAGLDFRTDDIKEHASPHPFETLYSINSDRFRPGYSEICARVFNSSQRISGEKNRTSFAHTAFSGWFSGLPVSAKNRIKRINPGTAIEGIEVLPESSALKLIMTEKNSGPALNFTEKNLPEKQSRLAKAAEILDGWAKELNSIKAAEPDVNSHAWQLFTLIDAAAAAKHRNRKNSGKQAEETGNSAAGAAAFILDLKNRIFGAA